MHHSNVIGGSETHECICVVFPEQPNNSALFMVSYIKLSLQGICIVYKVSIIIRCNTFRNGENADW